MKIYPIAFLLVFALITTSCTKNEGGSESKKGTPETNITISSVGETMAYDKSDLYVKAGESITLKFINNSTTLEHNWVLIKPGTNDKIGEEGIKAGRDKEFIPESPDVMTHTHLVAPKGQANAQKEKSIGEDTLTFKAPPAGDYPYICTNAGHHMVMKGTLHSLP